MKNKIYVKEVAIKSIPPKKVFFSLITWGLLFSLFFVLLHLRIVGIYMKEKLKQEQLLTLKLINYQTYLVSQIEELCNLNKLHEKAKVYAFSSPNQHIKMEIVKIYPSKLDLATIIPNINNSKNFQKVFFRDKLNFLSRWIVSIFAPAQARTNTSLEK